MIFQRTASCTAPDMYLLLLLVCLLHPPTHTTSPEDIDTDEKDSQMPDCVPSINPDETIQFELKVKCSRKSCSPEATDPEDLYVNSKGLCSGYSR